MRTFLIALFGLLPVSLGTAQADDVAAMVKELKLRRDDADPELIQKIANSRTREGMEGLLETYDLMASIFMKREVLRGLAEFDGVVNVQQPALEKIANIATNTRESELREAAIKALDQSQELGLHYLKQIVDSAAIDEVRQMALEAHIKRATEADVDWYKFIWNPERERRKDEEGNIKAFELEAIRELAFTGAAQFLSDDDLVEEIRRDQANPKIRRAALAMLAARNSPKTKEVARWMLDRVDIPGPDRSEAARVLSRIEGPRVAPTFLALAKKRDVTPEDLRDTMANLIVEMNDASVNKKVARQVGKGKPHQKVFALKSTVHIEDAKLVKRIRKGLKDRDLDVRRMSAEVLAERRDKDSIEDLERMFEKPKTPEDLRIALEALTRIRSGDATWGAKLVEMTAHDDRDTRNAALAALAKTEDTTYLDTIHERTKHTDWSTRYIAYRALRDMRDKSSVPLLIERLAEERGRMAKTVGDTLWSLTAMPFDEDLGRWQAWWKAESSKFEIATLGQLAKAKKELEMKRLMARTRSKAKFFGIRIISHRVLFIIDTSGSMLETMHGRGTDGRQATRIDIAKQELSQCIKNLAPNSLFNVLSFSSGIGYWMKEGIASSSDKTREDALEFVDRLGAQGATNLYDTIKVGFEDPDVDTIFILSDGEPTAGEITDPHRIREKVRLWNKHRNITINTIAIGGNLEVLEWLAEDSGGRHVRLR